MIGQRRLPTEGRVALLLVALLALAAVGLALLLWVDTGPAPAPAGPRGAAARADATPPRATDLADPGLREGSTGGALHAAGEPTGAREALAALDEQHAGARAWTGVVRDADSGAFVEGARVVLTLGERTLETTSDAQGAFELAWPADLEAQLAIEHPRYVDVRAPSVDLEVAGDFELVPSAALRGWVEPAPGPGAKAVAWLQAASSQRFWERREADVADDGRFELSDLDPGQYALTALVPGRCVAPQAGLRLERGDALELVLASLPGTRVAGRVVEEPRGRGVAAAAVVVEPRDDDLPSDHRREQTHETESGVDGRWSVEGLSPGRWRVSARAPWGGEVAQELEVAESGDLLELDLSLPGPAGLAGRVVDRAGRGVEGAKVNVVPVQRSSQVEGLLRGRDASVEPARSGPSGSFSLEAVPAATPLVVVARLRATDDGPDTARVAATRVDALAPGQQAHGVDVVLDEGYVLRGRVLSAAGEPIEGAAITLRNRLERARLGLGWATSGPDGRFEVRAPGTDEIGLEAEHPDWLPGRIWIESVAAAAEAGTELELRLEPTYVVEGLALDEQGFGVANLPISFYDCDANGQVEQGRSRRVRRTSTDAYGRFRQEDLLEGYWLVRGSSYEWSQVEVRPDVVATPGDAFVTLRFAPRERPLRAAIVGEVALADGGVPSGLRIEGLRGGVLAVDRGIFQATGLVPTRHRLTIRADGHAAFRSEAIDLPPGQRHDLGRIVLVPSTTLMVTVVDEDGQPVWRSRARLVPLPQSEGGAGETAGALRLRARSVGRHFTSDATRHAWRLVVDSEGFQRYAQRLEVKAQERQNVKVELKRAKDG